VAPGQNAMVYQLQSNANSGQSPEWFCRLEQITSYRLRYIVLSPIKDIIIYFLYLHLPLIIEVRNKESRLNDDPWENNARKS
jgi:hypothetical protein